MSEEQHETAAASFAGEADPLGPLARLFDSMPGGAYLTIAKRTERGRTLVVVSRQIPARGTVTADPFDTTSVDGHAIETRAALTLAALALEHKEANRA